MPEAEEPQIQRRKRSRGFTLIEIMAVVLIIGLLSTIVGVSIFAQVDKSRVTTASAQISSLEGVLELYRMDNANYPTTEEGLEAMLVESGKYLQKKRIPPDPWGNPYQYEQPGQNNPESFDLWSLGADGQSGGEGVNADVGNWFDDAGS
jgi:general secretion pathway protein G